MNADQAYGACGACLCLYAWDMCGTLQAMRLFTDYKLKMEPYGQLLFYEWTWPCILPLWCCNCYSHDKTWRAVMDCFGQTHEEVVIV